VSAGGCGLGGLQAVEDPDDEGSGQIGDLFAVGLLGELFEQVDHDEGLGSSREDRLSGRVLVGVELGR